MDFSHRRRSWLADYDSSRFCWENDGGQTATVLLGIRVSGYLLADFVFIHILKSGSLSPNDDSSLFGKRQWRGCSDLVIFRRKSLQSMDRYRCRRWGLCGLISSFLLDYTPWVKGAGGQTSRWSGTDKLNCLHKRKQDVKTIRMNKTTTNL